VPSEAIIAAQRHDWLSMKHVGTARPALRVFVRKGHLERHYESLPDDQVFSYVPGLKGPNWVYYAEWVADTDYIEVPNVKDAKGDQDYSQNGVESVSLTFDNIAMVQQTGKLGTLFHLIERGYYAPQRGNKPPSGGERVASKNSWFDTWKDKATQIAIVAGYGEAVIPLFVGLVDNVRVTSRPDTIVATCRSMGQFLTDQHTFEDAKNIWVKDPITFCDRQKADDLTNEANTAESKDDMPGHPARFAVDGSDTTDWLSDAYTNANGQTYIEVPLPAGRYEDFKVLPSFDGLECYVSVFATNDSVPGGGAARRTDGSVVGEGWINDGPQVPGQTIHRTNHIGGLKQATADYPVKEGGGGYVIGNNSRLRLWFTNLHKAVSDNGKGYTHRAGLTNLEIFKRTRNSTAQQEHWILVDDVSDIVKTVLQWVGLTEWEIESVGVRLKDKLVFDRQTFLIDIIKKIAELTSYVFYVKAPEEFDVDNLHPGNPTNLSMGIAVFRQGSAMKLNPPDRVEALRETNLLTSAEATFDANVLPQSIRVRGKAVGAKEKSTDIHPLGADPTFRYQYSYRPVWARGGSSGQAHLRRHELHYDYLLRSVYECKIACLFIAFRAALESAKAEIEIPLWPLIQLDHQVLLFDTGTGLSSRLWVTNRSWNYSSGEKVEFKMNLGGALLDINDVAETRVELERALNFHGFMPETIARGPWEDIHRF